MHAQILMSCLCLDTHVCVKDLLEYTSSDLAFVQYNYDTDQYSAAEVDHFLNFVCATMDGGRRCGDEFIPNANDVSAL